MLDVKPCRNQPGEEDERPVADIFRSADYARAKETSKGCEGQHAWGADKRGWRCQLCGERRNDNPQKTHDELRKMFPDPWSGGRFE